MGFIYVKENSSEFDLNPEKFASSRFKGLLGKVFGINTFIEQSQRTSIIPLLLDDLYISQKDYKKNIQPFLKSLNGFHLVDEKCRRYLFRLGDLDEKGNNTGAFSLFAINNFLLGESENLQIPIQDISSYNILSELKLEQKEISYENRRFFSNIYQNIEYTRQQGVIQLRRENNKIQKNVLLNAMENVSTKINIYKPDAIFFDYFVKD